MSKIVWSIMAAVFFAAFSVPAGEYSRDTRELPPGHPPLDASSDHMSAGHQAGAGPILAGEILETMDTGNYTYILVKTPEKNIWAAAEQFDVVVGARVSIPKGMLVKGFESPSLNRTFEEIYFADSVDVLSPGVATESDLDVKDVSEAGEIITPPENGLTIADIHRRSAELAGSTVVVRGRVVKFTERVLGKNWIHIVDGSGNGTQNDLTVSTTDSARVGDLVTVQGPVAINEDLGHGYFYEVLIKGASVVRE